VRPTLVFVIAAAVLVGAAAPGAPPEYPVSFIGVDALKAMVDAGTAVEVIDVRTRGEYDQLHITGARSIPLRDMPDRLREIPKTRPVVFY
jgi:sulfur-carrier protein adenylyltransferase/sulfurtransferase